MKSLLLVEIESPEALDRGPLADLICEKVKAHLDEQGIVFKDIIVWDDTVVKLKSNLLNSKNHQRG